MVGYSPDDARNLGHKSYAFAGATSGFVTRVVAQPLDVIKIRFQLQVEPITKSHISKYSGMMQATSAIYREEGLTAFWKGHVPAQLLSVVFGLVQFAVFEMLTKQVWCHLPAFLTKQLQPVTHFACGGLAGCAATLAAQPFDVMRTRFVAQGSRRVYSSVWQSSQRIIEKEGARALYKGLVPSLIQIAPQNGFQFGFYSIFISIAKRGTGKSSSDIGPISSLICGSSAGFCAKMIVYPLDLLKKRLQISGFAAGRPVTFGETHSHTSLVQCLRRVVVGEGILGLYKGFVPSALKAAVTAACHFTIYEQVCAGLDQFHRYHHADVYQTTTTTALR